MTNNEFKAWFEGFTEAMGGNMPTKKQWDKIKEKIAAIDGIAYVYPQWYRPYPTTPYLIGNHTITTSSTSLNAVPPSLMTMQNLGKIEAESLQ